MGIPITIETETKNDSNYIKRCHKDNAENSTISKLYPLKLIERIGWSKYTTFQKEKAIKDTRYTYYTVILFHMASS